MEDIFDAIDMAPQPQQGYLQKLFKQISLSSRSCHVVKVKADTKFIYANDFCHTIWILIEGQVRGIEEQSSGDVYVFSEFQAPELFGEMEGLAGTFSYKATLVTSTDCQFIVMPMENYLNWIRNDAEALFLRTRSIMSFIMEQTKSERSYLFLDGINRLILFMTEYYRKYAKNATCLVQMKRQEIADQIGFSLRTINRAIKKLSEDELITKNGREIIISEKQYEQLLGFIDKKFSK